mmetsp:Transcript_9719/g.24216  ORF Transcript_9719/g.24216 Transcript_9719/m.24216 type:complete len:209 (+) Transcript_9719:1577-2203(+)
MIRCLHPRCIPCNPAKRASDSTQEHTNDTEPPAAFSCLQFCPPAIRHRFRPLEQHGTLPRQGRDWRDCCFPTNWRIPFHSLQRDEGRRGWNPWPCPRVVLRHFVVAGFCLDPPVAGAARPGAVSFPWPSNTAHSRVRTRNWCFCFPPPQKLPRRCWVATSGSPVPPSCPWSGSCGAFLAGRAQKTRACSRHRFRTNPAIGARGRVPVE